MTIAVSPDSLDGAPVAANGLRLSPRRSQAIMLLVFAVAAAAGFLITDGAAASRAAAHAGADLTRLLRAMAAIKAGMALGAVAAVVWRLKTPATAPWLAGYALACAAMAVGPGLIWDMARLGLGALLLHAGLGVTLIMLWRDPEVGRRLSAVLAARRAARG